MPSLTHHYYCGNKRKGSAVAGLRTLTWRHAMLRRMLVLCAVMWASLLTVPASARAPQLVSNLVPNGGFTNGAGGMPVGFLKDAWGDGLRFTHTYPVAGKSGRGARVEIFAPYPGEGDAKWAFGLKPVTPGKFYYFTDQFKATGHTQVTLEYQRSNGTLGYVDLAWYEKSPTSWSKAELRFRMPADAVKAQVYHYPVGVGRLDTDTIVFGQIKPRGGAAAVLVFDDGNDNFWIAQKLKNNGVLATYCLIPGTFNPWDADLGYMTVAQAKTLRKMGHEISCNHTQDHLHLTSIPASQALSEIVTGRDNLWGQLGVKAETFAYPFGEWNTSIAAMVRDSGHVAARTVDWGYNTKLTNPYALKTISIDRFTTLPDVFAEIDNAMRLGQLIILTLHAINDTQDQYSNSEAFLMAVVNHIKAIGMPFDTLLGGFTELK